MTALKLIVVRRQRKHSSSIDSGSTRALAGTVVLYCRRSFCYLTLKGTKLPKL